MVTLPKAIEDIIREKIREAKLSLKTGQELEPQCYFVVYYPTEDKYSNIALKYVYKFFEDGVNRASLIPHINKSWQTLQILAITEKFPVQLKAVVLISDAWHVTRLSSTLEDKKPIPLPSSQPDRHESIHCLIDMNRDKFGYWYIYDRIDNRIIFEPERAGGILGDDERFNFTNLWPKGA